MSDEAPGTIRTSTDDDDRFRVTIGIVARLFIGISGGSRWAITSNYEKFRQVSIGASIPITALWATVGGYLFLTNAVGTSHLNVIGAILWGGIVGIIDWSLVSQPSEDTFTARARRVWWRALLVVIVSILVGEVVAHAVFKDEIDVELIEQRTELTAERADQIRADAPETEQIAALDAEEGGLRGEVAALHAGAAELQGRVDHYTGLIYSEEEGHLGGRDRGCGAYCQALQDDKAAAEGDLAEVRAQADERIAVITARLSDIETRRAHLRGAIDRRVDDAAEAVTSRVGFFDRVDALNDVTLGADAFDKLFYRGLLVLLLILVETFTIGLKVTKQSTHDRLVKRNTAGKEEIANLELELWIEREKARLIYDHVIALSAHGSPDIQPPLPAVREDSDHEGETR